MTRLGTLRAYYLGAVCCIAGFLFGYDSGIIGGVLTLKSFMIDYDYGKADQTRISSLAVALQQLGALVACFAIWPVTHRWGRKWSLIVCSIIHIVGATIQTVNTHSRAAFFVGRVIAGLALGGSSVVVPMFSGEMAPKHIRGQVGSFYQLMFTLGIFTSYWIDYGVAKHIPKTQARQWQIPLGLQILPAALLGLGMLTLKESTRWLTSRGRYDDAWESLTWIRADSSEETHLEMDEIRAGVEYEAHAKRGFHFKELLAPCNLKRLSTAAAVFTAQQATGATAFAYYGPQYFKLLVGSKDNTSLLLTAIFGAVKVGACLLFVLFVADNVGRRYILTAGALFMAACQISAAAVLRSFPAPKTPSSDISHSGIAAIALIYLFVIAYNFSWGPLPWPYVAEIFPPRIREPGIGVGVGFQWLFNFVFSLTTPYMIRNMGWGTFLLWGVFDILIAIYSWFGLTETRGRTLEEIAAQGRSGVADAVPTQLKREQSGESERHIDSVSDSGRHLMYQGEDSKRIPKYSISRPFTESE
ncbi:general substrate transporter [Lecanosticta acicola]|uniref:General substrate transporter n=1 Tax=Lecanosticta acicola TaxID=111012 RepID=A0AAI9E9E3_9PEZI|nr:general substrate transporter [Lecanosticta acicola]